MRPYHSLLASLAWLTFFSCVGSNLVKAQTPSDTILVTLVATRGDDQTVRIGTELPIPFAVRATDQNGAAVAGLSVSFGVNFCLDPPLLPPTCPPYSLYGSFAGESSVAATTDANGIAVASAFTAGASNGMYSVFPYFSAQEINGILYLYNPNSLLPLFDITQIGGVSAGGTVAAPTLGAWQMVIASILMATCGAWFARRRADRN